MSDKSNGPKLPGPVAEAIEDMVADVRPVIAQARADALTATLGVHSGYV